MQDSTVKRVAAQVLRGLERFVLKEGTPAQAKRTTDGLSELPEGFVHFSRGEWEPMQASVECYEGGTPGKIISLDARNIQSKLTLNIPKEASNVRAGKSNYGSRVDFRYKEFHYYIYFTD